MFGNTPSAASAFKPVPTNHLAPDVATPVAASKATARPVSSKGKKRAAIAAVGRALAEGKFVSEKPAKRPRQRKVSSIVICRCMCSRLDRLIRRTALVCVCGCQSSVTEPRPEETSVPSTSPVVVAASPTPSIALEPVAEVAVASAWEDEADFSADEEDIDIVFDHLPAAPSPPVKLVRPPVVIKAEKRSSPLPTYLPQTQVQPTQQDKV